MHAALLTHEPFYPPSGGGSAAAVYLVRHLVKRGHKVSVFGPQIPDTAAVEQRFGIRFHPFTAWPMGRTTSLRTPKYLAYPKALERLVLRTVASGDRPDVLVAQHSISAVAAGALRRRLGIPIILNLLDCLTGFLETWPPYLMPRPVARALVRYELSLPRRCAADGVLTVSDPLRDRIVAGGYPADRTLAIYYGYDAALFRRPEGAAPGDPNRVVMHGSFDHHHLGAIALDAVLRIAQARPEVRFRFAGPRTPALRKFLAAVHAKAPQARIEELGFIGYDQIPAMLAECGIGLTPYEPSTGTHCAFVAKTVEYLALGLPLACTPLENAMGYYRGLEGIRFSEATGASFASVVLDWLATPMEERARKVAPAQAKVRAELDWGTVCGRAVDFVERVVGRAIAAALRAAPFSCQGL